MFQSFKKSTQVWILTVSLAGFLFGFDTVVISGANEPIKVLWNTSGWFHGIFIMSMALWGTVIGALLGSYPANLLGRKSTLFWIGVFYFVSALGSALSNDPYLFSFFRFIGGIGVGASSVAAPTYISEISNAKSRGRLVATYQFNIVFGILIAYLSNYFIALYGGDLAWRWMLGVEAVPALIYILLMSVVPNSPRWLVTHKGDETSALAVLKDIYSDDQLAAEELANIRESSLDKNPDSSSSLRFFSGRFNKPIMLAFLLAFFNQLSGINFVLYYAPVILERAGFASTESLLSSVSIGGTNLIFTFVGLYLIDRAGRKSLMYLGSLGYIVSLAMIAYGFYFESSAGFTLFFILMFIASHAVGQGAVIWVFISEIFPNNVRAKGQAFGSGTHWVFAAIVTMLGEVVMTAFPAWTVFAFFALFMVLQLLFTHFLMPETKGKSLEELQKELVK